MNPDKLSGDIHCNTPRPATAFFGTAYGIEVYYEIVETRYFTYTVDLSGEAVSSIVPSPPDGYSLTGIGHTHAAFDPKLETAVNGNDVLPTADIKTANRLGIPTYLATPLGMLRRYDPNIGIDQVIFSDAHFHMVLIIYQLSL